MCPRRSRGTVLAVQAQQVTECLWHSMLVSAAAEAGARSCAAAHERYTCMYTGSAFQAQFVRFL